ncbi:MAG: nuclear transport factor 2 family protein [Solirubrobacterales bacterium]
MSQENVDAVRQLVQAFNRRDLPAMTRWFGAEIEWMPGGPAAVERPVYRGLDDVSGGFVATWETWDVFCLEEQEVRDLGESVLWLGRSHLRGGASHLDLDEEFAVRLLMDHGKVVCMHGFSAWQDALRAAGFSE